MIYVEDALRCSAEGIDGKRDFFTCGRVWMARETSKWYLRRGGRWTPNHVIGMAAEVNRVRLEHLAAVRLCANLDVIWGMSA